MIISSYNQESRDHVETFSFTNLPLVGAFVPGFVPEYFKASIMGKSACFSSSEGRPGLFR